MKVRKLPKILETQGGVAALRGRRFRRRRRVSLAKTTRASRSCISCWRRHPRAPRKMSVSEMVEARQPERLEILRALRADARTCIENVERVPRSGVAQPTQAVSATCASHTIRRCCCGRGDRCGGRLPRRRLRWHSIARRTLERLPLPFKLGRRPDAWGVMPDNALRFCRGQDARGHRQRGTHAQLRIFGTRRYERDGGSCPAVHRGPALGARSTGRV